MGSENAPHQLGERRTDFCSLILEISWEAAVEYSLEVFREVVAVSLTVPVPGNGVLLNELLLKVDLDGFLSHFDPDDFPDIGVRNGVTFLLDLDIMVGMDLGLSPVGRL